MCLLGTELDPSDGQLLRLSLPILLLALCDACRREPAADPMTIVEPPYLTGAGAEGRVLSRATEQSASAGYAPPSFGSDSSSGSTGRLRPEQARLQRVYAQRPVLAVLHGKATWYADSLAGRSTASGEPYDPKRYTAAHLRLPFGTVLRVRTVPRGRWVYVRINDRGPVGYPDRILDLSRVAAEQIDLIRPGVLAVRAEVLEYGVRSARQSKRRHR
ncbi:septal ring lytic transglycosylase RlpA family protein [Myxococcota bacterium]